jgi:hypothetical protein
MDRRPSSRAPAPPDPRPPCGSPPASSRPSPDRAGRPDHAPLFKAPITAAIVAADAPFSIVTFAPATSIAITATRRRETAREARWRGGFDGGAAAVGSGTITAGTKAGSVAAVLRASRRHVNTCCGASPWRRATTDTTAPGTSVSSTIRARSSTLQRLRPIAPLITSRRRTGPDGSSLWSSLDTKRSSRSDRYCPSSERTGEGEVGAPHTQPLPIAVLKASQSIGRSRIRREDSIGPSSRHRAGRRANGRSGRSGRRFCRRG